MTMLHPLHELLLSSTPEQCCYRQLRLLLFYCIVHVAPGSTRGPVIGDHMPPNKLVGDKDKLSKAMQELPGVAKVGIVC